MNKYFMITGATGGLGKAFCIVCAQRGISLFLTDLSNKSLNDLATGLKNEYDIDVRVFACDLTRDSERDRLFQYIGREDLHFSGLINVAGLDIEGSFVSLSPCNIRTIVKLNILATSEVIQNILPYRIQYERFMIINVASQAAFQPMPYKAMYSASKRFLLQLSLALREELRPYKVTVTALCPSGMPTTSESVDGIDAQGFLGQITAKNVGDVAEEAFCCAERGKAIVIPGKINRVLKACTSLMPQTWVAHLLRTRWSKALQKRRGTVGALTPHQLKY